MFYCTKSMCRDFADDIRSHTISRSAKNSFWTGAGLCHTHVASWAIDWTVHSKRKKFAGSLSHIVCRVCRSWQQSRESTDRSKQACSRLKACRFFTVEPVDNDILEDERTKKVAAHQEFLTFLKKVTMNRTWVLYIFWMRENVFLY